MHQDPTIPQPSPTGTPAQPVMPEKRKREGLRSIVSTLLILIAAPLVALALTAFVFQSYEVDGPSMESTLQNHDRLIVWKVPRSWARITDHPYVPKRGDVIVFIKHGLQEYGDSQQDKQLIKRVVGLPGDRVVVKDGSLTIYNAQQPQGFSPDLTSPYGKVIQTTTGSVDVIIQPGEIFVCGDNRANSLDSRYFGPVKAQDIVGKLVVRVFPLSEAKVF